MTHPEGERADLATVAYKHGVDAAELERVVEIESGWNTRAVNRDSGATGLIQLSRVNMQSLGTDSATVQAMTFAQQCDLIDKYLAKVKHPIGRDAYMAIAAPGYIGAPDETVIYAVNRHKGSAWLLNPGWRSANDGPITAGSIRNYFANPRTKNSKSQSSGAGLSMLLLLLVFVLRSRRR